MVAPIDYTLPGVQSPFQALAQGMQFGAGLAQAQAQRQQLEAQAALAQQKAAAEQAALERQRQIGTAMSALIANPNRTAQDYEAVAVMLPEKEAASLRANFEMRTKEQQGKDLGFAMQTMSAFDAGSPDVGLRLLREKAQAERNSGREDQAKAYETWASIAEQNPQAASATIGTLVSRLPGGKEAIEGYAKVRDQQRVAQLASFTLRKETAEAIIKEAEAKLASERFLAGLDLTRAQIDQAKAAQAASRAAERASGAAAQRAAAEAQSLAAGVIPVEKRPDLETKFRKEYSDQTAGYREVKSAYGRVLASQDNAVGDLSLIFGYMKMLDPGSVVREGEFATAQNAAGVPDRVLNIYNRILRGERLNEGQRKAFKGQAEGLFKQAGQQEAAVRSGLERIAKGYGLNTANIFLEAVESAPTAPKMGGPEIPTAAPAAPPTPMAPAEGTRSTSKTGRPITFRGGRWVYD